MISKVKIPDNVVSRTVQGEEVVLNLKTSHYFGLDSIGSKVWSAIQKNTDMDALVESLSKEYDASADQIRSDVETLLKTMKEKGIVRFN